MIWGENGSGKTSVLEAIHILSYGKSFRTHKQRELIKKSENSLVARGDFSTNGHRDNVAAQVTQTNGQKLKLNVKKMSKFSIIPLTNLSNLSIDGAEWNLKNKNIQFGETTTLRNIANEDELNVSCDKRFFAFIY